MTKTHSWENATARHRSETHIMQDHNDHVITSAFKDDMNTTIVYPVFEEIVDVIPLTSK